MGKRIITGVFLIFFVYLLIKHLTSFGFFIAAGLLAALAQAEFYCFLFKTWRAPLPVIGLIMGGFISASLYFHEIAPLKELIVNILLVLLIFSTLYSKPEEIGLHEIAIVFFGIFYIPWLVGHLISVRELINAKNLLFFLFLVTYASDTGAYFIGKAFGVRKLCPEISPNKTWAGAAGGLFASVAAAVMANRLLDNLFSFENTIILGLLLGVTGQIGDLAESVLKRSAGIKDSGNIIPGHGGVLDRIDSLIFTAPVYYYYIIFFILHQGRYQIPV